MIESTACLIKFNNCGNITAYHRKVGSTVIGVSESMELRADSTCFASMAYHSRFSSRCDGFSLQSMRHDVGVGCSWLPSFRCSFLGGLGHRRSVCFLLSFWKMQRECFDRIIGRLEIVTLWVGYKHILCAKQASFNRHEVVEYIRRGVVYCRTKRVFVTVKLVKCT